MTRPLALLLVLLAAPAVAEPARETVVLLHGLGRTARSMSDMAEALAGAGYDARNLDYPSRDASLEQLGDWLEAQLATCCARAARLHFVTHSMGGILVRVLLARGHPPALGRVVMLSPPNRGSEIIDVFGEQAIFAAIMGPAASELSTAPEGTPRSLPRVDFPLGVITGDSPSLFSWLIPGADDGKVSVDSARVDGMADFLVVSEGHTFIMNDDGVQAQVRAFLREGAFER